MRLCYPLDFDDLRSELDIAAAIAIPKFRGVPTRTAVLAGKRVPKLSTYLWEVMENHLKDLARHALRKPPSVPLEPAPQSDDPPSHRQSATTGHTAPADAVVGAMTLRAAMREVPDSDLILWQLAGYRDSEISKTNLRMRRARARSRLAQRLDSAA